MQAGFDNREPEMKFSNKMLEGSFLVKICFEGLRKRTKYILKFPFFAQNPPPNDNYTLASV